MTSISLVDESVESIQSSHQFVDLKFGVTRIHSKFCDERFGVVVKLAFKLVSPREIPKISQCVVIRLLTSREVEERIFRGWILNPKMFFVDALFDGSEERGFRERRDGGGVKMVRWMGDGEVTKWNGM